MLTINIITVGKLKEKYLRDASDEYCKRLSAFCRINIVELQESRIYDNPSQKEIASALDNEAKAILNYMESYSSFTVAMCIEGIELSSKELSEKIEAIAVSGKSTVNFIIGSSFGISPELKNRCDYKLSMSKMTFPHQLARIMLTEQIYRAFQISVNSKYHK